MTHAAEVWWECYLPHLDLMKERGSSNARGKIILQSRKREKNSHASIAQNNAMMKTIVTPRDSLEL